MRINSDRLSAFVHRIDESLWFIPALFVASALIIAPLTIYVDANFEDFIDEVIPFIFEGGPDGARVVLSTIATAIATIIGIAFSIVIVVLQLAASQYSPRVITTFRRDKGQQIVMGMYLATFIYALLVVRQVRGGDDDISAFVPVLSMLIAVIFAVVCLGLLVYFVHHISQQLRISVIARNIHRDLTAIGKDLYPHRVASPFDEERSDEELIAELEASNSPRFIIRAGRAGYLQRINGRKFSQFLQAPVYAIQVRRYIGEFIFEGGILGEIYFEGSALPEDQELWKKIGSKCFVIGSEPTLSQNSQMGIQQLVDIALRALSTGVNDPSTAEQVLGYMSDWIAQLASCSFPSQVRKLEDRMLILPRPTFEDHLAQAFAPIRRAARTQVSLLHPMVQMLEKIVETDPPKKYLPAMAEQLEALKRAVNETNVPDEQDRKNLLIHIHRLLDRLPTATQEIK